MHFSQWSSLLFKPSVNADGNTMPNGAEQFADARSSAVPEKWETIGLTMKIFVKGCEGNCNGIQSVDPPAEKTSEQMGGVGVSGRRMGGSGVSMATKVHY